jgi:formylglycine-generating enzyme
VREDEEVITVGPVFMQKYEVSQGEFKKVMGENPSYRDQDSLPVERVTWDEAQNYCTEVGGRLPTEAEWEYAGHGGGSGLPWAKGKASEYAWFNGNADGHTRKVGQLKPNAMGLYDMAGNVFEWVEDWYAPYEPGVTDHPKGPNNGTARVIRGASWFSEEANLNPSARFSNRPGFRNYKVGFRCVHNLPASPATAEKTPLPTTP